MLNRIQRFFFLSIVISGISSYSCAYYSMAGSIPPHINNIFIPLVENQTAEFGMSEFVTENLINKFTEENILRVTTEDQSTSILKGTIIKVVDAPYTFTAQEAVTEYRLTITMGLEWYDVKNDKTLLNKKFSAWGAYGISGDINNDGIDNDGDGLVDEEDDNEFGDPREFATQVAIKKIAEDVLNEIMTSW